MAPRRAFSVIEVLVALVIVTVGLLGMAGAGAVATHAANAAGREREAVATALARLAALSAGGCHGAVAGSNVIGRGARERWSLGAASGGVAMADARVEWDEGSGRRTVLLQSTVLC